MEVLKEGTKYILHNYGSETDGQYISFTEKNPTGGYFAGTTNEEVIDMMINRLYALQNKAFSVENQVIIILLKNIKWLFGKRLNNKVSYLKQKHDEFTNQELKH